MPDKSNQKKSCDSCRHNDKGWVEEPCESCCGFSGYERAKKDERKLQGIIKRYMGNENGGCL